MATIEEYKEYLDFHLEIGNISETQYNKLLKDAKIQHNRSWKVKEDELNNLINKITGTDD